MDPNPKIVKSVYVALFAHVTAIEDTEMTIVAANFTEAVKKAENNSAIVSAGKEDVVTLKSIEMVSKIDVE